MDFSNILIRQIFYGYHLTCYYMNGGSVNITCTVPLIDILIDKYIYFSEEQIKVKFDAFTAGT